MVPHIARGRVCVPLCHRVRHYVRHYVRHHAGVSSAQEPRRRDARVREGPHRKRPCERQAAIFAADATQSHHRIHPMHRNRRDGAAASNQNAVAPPCLVENLVFLALAAGLHFRTFFPPLGPALHHQTGCSAKCIREINRYANVQDSPRIWQLSGLAVAAVDR